MNKLLEIEIFNTNQFLGLQFAPGALNAMVSKFQKNEGKTFGELGVQKSPIINLKNVSHEVKNVRVDGARVLCDIEILDTPSGRILNNFTHCLVPKPRIIASKSDCEIENSTLITIDFDICK